jgi:nondiscriminating aspartyl-tRNA synthetase
MADSRPVRTLAAELPSRTAEPDRVVRLNGWIHRRRRLSGLAFVIVRDRSGLAQVVVRDDAVLALVDTLTEETTVEVVGVASANAQAPGGVEVVDPQFRALTSPAATPPVELWRPKLSASLPTLLHHGQVTLRHRTRQARWRLAEASIRGFSAALDERGFTQVKSPKLVESATESGANVFRVDYFGGDAYLAQSPQFYKQMLVGVFERVYEVGPVFRAEPHDTVRHLSEYVSLDVEFGFIDDHRDVIAMLRDVVHAMTTAVAERAAEAVDLLGVRLPDVPEEIPVIHFSEALAIAGAPEDEADLAPAHERAVGEWALAEHGSDFVAVEGYPMAKRPFYTHPAPDPRWSNSFDLIFRGVELVTGGQRLHRHEDYLLALAAAGQSPEPYAGYLDTFRFGMPPHGGFAIGLERWAARLVEADNVREVCLFPRDLHRLAP